MSETQIFDSAPSTTENATATTSVVEAAPVTTAVGSKTKAQKTGNLILDIAHEVEGLSKVKALNEADKLADNIEVSYIRLGGVLKVIYDNSWFDGFADFATFVYEKYGFAERKAKYLMTIYDNLVTKQIPWEKVQHLGWTKLKDLAPVLTLENLDEWIAKATPLTVLELQAMLKATKPASGEQSSSVKADVTKMTFALKADQIEIVNQALAKAKGVLQTEFDTVALENICAGYVGGNSEVAKPYSLDEVIENTGFETLMTRIGEMFPEYDISIAPAGEAAGDPTSQVAEGEQVEATA